MTQFHGTQPEEIIYVLNHFERYQPSSSPQNLSWTHNFGRNLHMPSFYKKTYRKLQLPGGQWMLQQDEITDPWPEGHSSEVLSKTGHGSFSSWWLNNDVIQADGEMDLEWMFDKRLWNKGRWWRRKDHMWGSSAWMSWSELSSALGRDRSGGHSPWLAELWWSHLARFVFLPLLRRGSQWPVANWSQSRVFQGCGIFSAKRDWLQQIRTVDHPPQWISPWVHILL